MPLLADVVDEQPNVAAAMIGGATYALFSTGLAASVLLSSLLQRPNAYSAAVYVSKSNACCLVLWNFGICLSVALGRLLQIVFFGALRIIELEVRPCARIADILTGPSQRLKERLWYTVTETLLALTIFRDEFDTAFVALFVSLLFVKVFHWLAADRVEYMEQTPAVGRLFHFRMVGVLAGLWLTDMLLIGFALESILIEGPSVMIMFAAEVGSRLSLHCAADICTVLDPADVGARHDAQIHHQHHRPVF
jgi:hypothetical protein